MPKAKKITIEKVIKDYKRAGRFSSKWKKEAKEDLKFCLGEQWEKKIKDGIEAQGRPALTLNIIQPNIRLVTGYQRESRSSIKAYPEGKEDDVTSEVVTKLLKNVIKKSKAENVLSEAFETAVMARGKAFIEPYLDYTYDLLNGTLQFNILDGWQVRIDPNSVKYDLSDARYIIKEKKLTEDELLELFPEKEKEIEEGIDMPIPEDDGTIDEDRLLEDNEDYPGVSGMDNDLPIDEEEKTYKYIEYYYKKYISQYLAIDVNQNIAQFFKTKEEAKEHLIGLEGGELGEGQRVIEKRIPEIWVICSVGQTILEEKLSDSYPKWRGYPLIPLFGWYSSVGKRVLKREDLAYQGIASGLKDPQMEKNKRRSQSLAIINSITNRGWLTEENTWVDKEKVRKFGSTPGVTLEYKSGKPTPRELEPGNIPNAHIYFEEKSEEDIKLISGINPDMLAVQDKTTSGRAIALRQQQGLRILKPLFDNLVWTQEILGKYIVSQLSELYTIDKALKVLGGEFVDKHFRRNETDTPDILIGMAGGFVKEILDDPDLCNYDINIGEGLESPTERYAQFSSLMELAERGILIPPQILIEYADIPEGAKKEIMAFAQSAQNAAQPEPAAGKQPAERNRGRR
uniref:Putative portal protein n=1 Tax=viral metagenome TaxID=1070528 RepID=A0A6H1ZBI3_9ZZZZ